MPFLGFSPIYSTTCEQKLPNLSESRNGVVFLSDVLVVVDQSEASRLSASELSLQSVGHTASLLNLELLGQSGFELLLGDISTAWMQYVNNLEVTRLDVPSACG